MISNTPNTSGDSNLSSYTSKAQDITTKHHKVSHYNTIDAQEMTQSLHHYDEYGQLKNHMWSNINNQPLQKRHFPCERIVNTDN